MNRKKNYILFIFLFVLTSTLFQCQLPEAPDTAPPLVAIIYPVTGQPVSGTVRVAIEAADETEFSHVNLKIDGETRAQMTEPPFEYDWDTSPVADNQDHSLIAVGYDKAGNTTISPGVLVRVVAGPRADTLAPVISIINPTPGSTVKDTVIVTPQIIEDGGVDRVEYFIDGRLKFTSNQTPYEFNWDVTNLLNGSTHTVFARAFDENQNNSYSNVVSVTIESNNIIDNTPPVVAINYPTSGLTVSDTVSILATATDNVAVDRLELYVDGSLFSTLSQSPWIFPWNVTGYLSGSTHSIYIIAYDTNQNQTTSAIVTVTVQTQNIEDLTPPTIFLSNPAAGAIVEGTTTIIAEANDNISVTNVDFFIDGNLAGTDNTSPYEYIWDTSSLQLGSVHTLFAKAYDGAGNSGQTALQTATISTAQVDNIPPTVTILYPPAGAIIEDTIIVVAEANDNVSVTNVEFYINGNLAGTDNSSPYEYIWDTSSLQPGSVHTLYAKAYDSVGNSGQTALQTATISSAQVDNIPPTVTILYPPAGATYSDGDIITITADVVDNVGVQKVEFYIDGELLSTDPSTPYQYDWDTTGYGNGQSHSIYIKGYDLSGNIGAQLITVIIIP